MSSGIRKKDNLQVAIKTIKKENVEYEQVNGIAVPVEVASMARIRGIRGCIQLIDFFVLPSEIVIVMEKGGETLFDVLDRRRFDEDTARRLFCQLIQSVVDCSRRGVFHADLKIENVLVDSKHRELKLIDFGPSITEQIMPPEWHANGHCEQRPATSWMLGVILYEMLVDGHMPSCDGQSLHPATLRRQENLTLECRSLLRRLLEPDAHKRLRLDDILLDPWFHVRQPKRNSQSLQERVTSRGRRIVPPVRFRAA